ncbi:MAG: hypothetical protein JEZ09_06920 [Salinivirgaceae bacterium]|nr:hypothetical protein [Salinivirgaceae bacterium]
MLRVFYILIFVGSICIRAFAQDSTSIEKASFGYKGQLSTWAHVNVDNPYPLYIGGRYIPQANYEIRLPKNRLIDFEISANLLGDAGVHFFDSAEANGDINPYRMWGRYSTEQLEIRGGLQKIDFGTAVILRALRWFDQVDPRDPLRLTEGVWGGLMRYYFLNNTNIWLWGLYGNKNPKGTELIKSNKDIPEFGGRVQFSVPLGEAGLSYHHRMADSRAFGGMILSDDRIPENRLGIDAKWDFVVGLWFEGAWVNKSKDLGAFTNQETFTVGTDYTFGLGSGLNVTLEHMLFSNDQKAFNFDNTQSNTGLSINYPIGMFDNIQAIFYLDWTNNSVYNFVNWYKNFDHTTFYIMGYWNPESVEFASGGAQNLYGGKGIQIMFVYNH